MPAIDTASLNGQLSTLATDSVKDIAQAALDDSSALLARSQEKMQKYSDQLARGEIDRDQLENDLSQDLLALADMERLKDTGLSQIRVDAFAQRAVGVLVNAALTAAIGAVV